MSPSLPLESEWRPPASSSPTLLVVAEASKNPDEHRRRGRVAVRQADHESVEHDVNRPGASRSCAGGPGDRGRAANHFNIARHSAR